MSGCGTQLEWWELGKIGEQFVFLFKVDPGTSKIITEVNDQKI